MRLSRIWGGLGSYLWETINRWPHTFTVWLTISSTSSRKWLLSSLMDCLSFNLTLTQSGGRSRTHILTSRSTSWTLSSWRTGVKKQPRSERASSRRQSYMRYISGHHQKWKLMTSQKAAGLCPTRQRAVTKKDYWSHRSSPENSSTLESAPSSRRGIRKSYQLQPERRLWRCTLSITSFKKK